MITERQKRLIDKCKQTGYGWNKYACSVESQGFCTPLQEDKLIEMWQKINHAECVKSGNIKPDYNYCYDTDVSDFEAYQSGDKF